MIAHRFALGTRRLRILGTVSAVVITAALTLTGSSTFAAPLAGSVDPVAAATATPAILAPPDAIVGEGDGSVDFVVRLAEEGTDTVTVNFQTVSGTAAGGNGICNSDFVQTNGTLTFTPGEIEKIVPIVITDCVAVETFEGFTLQLSGATGGGFIARASQRISIVDSNNEVDSPHLFVRDAVVDERDRFAFVSVILGGANGQTSNDTVTVDYQTSNGTASDGSDFDGRSGEFSFSPGETVESVAIPITDDSDIEGAEGFTLTISTPDNATLSDPSGAITIGSSDVAGIAQPTVVAPADLTVGEVDGFVDLVVRLPVPGLTTARVLYETQNGTAAAGNPCNSDYTVAEGELVFLPGETTKVVRVQIVDCPGAESFEGFTFELGPALNGNVTISRSTTRVSIVDNDTIVPLGQLPLLHVRDAVVDERDGVALVSVLLGGPTGQASLSTITVNYTTANGTASAGSDYATSSGTLTFDPGETTKTIPVAITDDGDGELAERVTLNLSTALNAQISDGSGVITIGASDQGLAATPRILAPTDMIVSEAEGYVDLVVRLSTRSTGTVSADYTTQNSTASGGNPCNSDFTVASGKLIFAPGETTKVVRVQIVDCPGAEAFEGFTFELSGQVNSTIGRERGRISIVDNDTQVPTPTLHVRDAFVDEKDGVALVSVLLGSVLGEKSLSSITVDYATADGSAGDTDYTDSAGTLTFAPGETTKTVVVPITDDGSPEPNESFTLGLSNQTNSTIADGTGLIVIGGSDQAEVASPGIFAPADVAVSEGAGYVDLVVNLDAPGLNPVSVDYTTVNETASGGNPCNSDYVVTAGEIVFAPGETTKVVRVQIVDCPNVEGAETFRFQLSGATGSGVISRVSGQVTIGDNDGVVTLSSIAVTPASPSIAVGADQQFTATGTFSDASTQNLTGTATWGSQTTGVATISAGGLAQGVSAGTSTISAVQSGITGSTVLTVTQSQQAQTITFAALGNKTWGDPDFPVSATASSGLTVSFAASGNCTVAGVTVHITGAGSCTITASQAGNGSFLPATPVARSFTIGKAGQTISFGALGDKTVGDPDFAVSATASSGLAVSFAASGTCTVNGQTVHLTGAGTCTITASQAGNANYNAATPVARSFQVTQTQQPQTITFAALGNKTWGDPDFTVSATASSGLPVSFSAGGTCTVSGSTVHIVGAGGCQITASQPGNASYLPASNVARPFTVAKANQTISFAALANKRLGDPDFTVSATASSGLAVSFAAGGSCTISGTRVHLTGEGRCTIGASQAGNANYNAATAIARSFTIGPRPVRCRVPNVVGKSLARAKALLKQRHCRTGTVTKAFSRARRNGVVIGQSKRPGRVLAANSKVNLVVSRGRRR